MPTVLIVDDSRFQLNKLGKSLTEIGYETLEAQSGREALDKIEAQVPDVIITDLHMNDINGFELLKKLQELGKNIPTIVLSADIQSEIIQEVKDLGATGFLSKPLAFDQLKKTLDKIRAA